LKTVVVSVSNDITHDQRVAKVCSTLHNNGFQVKVVGRKLKNSRPLNFPYQTKRIKLLFNKGFLFYFELNVRLFFFLLFTKKDVLLANDLDTLLPNHLVSKLTKKKLVFDSHEFFSEIPELVDRNFTKQVWQTLERLLIPKQKLGITVSNGIAQEYLERFKVSFNVIKNYPKRNETIKNSNSNPFDGNDKSIILYQGAVNLGRGLELMIDTMHYLPDCQLVIIGDGDLMNELKNKVESSSLSDRISFLGKKTPEDLRKITPWASIGISLEEDLGLNYRYALPNKLFDYIQAEVPVLVSNLPEMKHIVETHKVGEVINSREPEALAEQMKKMLHKDFSKNLSKAKKEFIWEYQEQKLLAIFQ
tara:strand:+ start:34392 stop:35474 length:1083 start_codon:yes stop_codon:yes gene_type:complete